MNTSGSPARFPVVHRLRPGLSSLDPPVISDSRHSRRLGRILPVSVKAQTSTVRVLLVDDHPAVLAQVTQLLPAEFEVVRALTDGRELMTAMEKHHPEIVLLDITLPGTCGIDLAAQLRRAGNPVKVVFLTVHDDPDYVGAALSAGASGYVVKSRLAADLIPALRAVLEGRQFISPGGKHAA